MIIKRERANHDSIYTVTNKDFDFKASEFNTYKYNQLQSSYGLMQSF